MQYIIICLISLFLYSPALADTLQGKVVKIADGDTVTIVDDSGKKHRIRFAGIDAPEKDQKRKEKEIIDMVSSEAELRSKKELIQKFIYNNLPAIENDDNVEDEFSRFWQKETKSAMRDLTSNENLDQEKVERIISDFLFTGRMATEDEILEALEKQPSVLQRESISTRITNKIQDFIATFLNGV